MLHRDPADRLAPRLQVLAYQGEGGLVTGDAGEPVMLGKLPAAVVQQYRDKLQDGMLLRLRIGSGGFFLDGSGNICGADLHLAGVANQIRRADLYSRIVFQWQLRTSQVNMESLIERVQQVSAGSTG